ncbi:MAG: GNAT family N-acetyltransferase [Anaerolineae bacterium]|nr:GNAT family N-acetyltransferase [Anaerolineae bacterium]
MQSSNSLLNGYTARPVIPDDLAIVTDLLNTCSIDEIGKPQQTEEEIQGEWDNPLFNLKTDTQVVFTPEGQIVGYVELWNPHNPPVRMYGWGRVHPDHRDQGIGTFLVRWAEARARQLVPTAPDNARVVILQGALKQNEAAQALFQQEGFKLVRHFHRMLIEMDAPPPEPVFPDGITVRTFVPNQDERAVFDALEEAFSDHWGHVAMQFESFVHWIESTPDFDASLWFIAMDGDEIAALSLCRPKLTEDPDMGWVAELCVRRPWRRQGIALALLHHSFGEFYRRGTRKVGLGVDSQNLTGATRLYEKAGMHVARQTVSFEKELRPGEDLETRTLEE